MHSLLSTLILFKSIQIPTSDFKCLIHLILPRQFQSLKNNKTYAECIKKKSIGVITISFGGSSLHKDIANIYFEQKKILMCHSYTFILF